MTDTTSLARLIQSPVSIVAGFSARIIDKGKATVTLFLGDTIRGAECGRRASVLSLFIVSLRSAGGMRAA